MMTRGLQEPTAPSVQSGHQRKQPRRRLPDPQSPCSGERSNWANLTTELAEDVAGRLLSVDVSEYIRFRAVCKPWRELTDDPRSRGGLDVRFRPRNWFPLCRESASDLRCRLRNKATGVILEFHLEAFSTSHLLSSADGLLVLSDKATNAVRLLHPLAGAVAEFPDITDVWPHEGAGLETRIGVDAFKARFPGLGHESNAYLATYAYMIGYPAFDTVHTSAGIDDSTSPPTLQLYVKGDPWLIIRAKPGDEHWVAMSPIELISVLEHRAEN